MPPCDSSVPLPDGVASTRNRPFERLAALSPVCFLQSKKVAVAGGDASIRIIDIVEEKAADLY